MTQNGSGLKRRSLYIIVSKSKILSDIYDNDWLSHLCEFEDVCDQYSIVIDDHIQMLKLTMENEAKVFISNAIDDFDLTWPALPCFSRTNKFKRKTGLLIATDFSMI